MLTLIEFFTVAIGFLGLHIALIVWMLDKEDRDYLWDEFKTFCREALKGE